MKTNSATSVAAGAWRLRLYIAGTTPRAVAALANLERICEERLHGRYMVEVVDLRKTPRLAKDDQILAVPTLVRRLLLPIRKIIDDLSNVEHVLVGLELKPQLPGDIDATEI